MNEEPNGWLKCLILLLTAGMGNVTIVMSAALQHISIIIGTTNAREKRETGRLHVLQSQTYARKRRQQH